MCMCICVCACVPPIKSKVTKCMPNFLNSQFKYACQYVLTNVIHSTKSIVFLMCAVRITMLLLKCMYTIRIQIPDKNCITHCVTISVSM